MKTEIKVTELSHDELVDIFSTATYGNSMMGICVADDSVDLMNKLALDENVNTSCREDLWAEVLLHGGNLCVIDAESEAEDEEDAKKNAYSGNAHKVGFVTLNGWCGEYGATTYEINLKELLNGCCKENAYNYLKCLLDGDGDLYTAYNLMQIITFGEIIYG